MFLWDIEQHLLKIFGLENEIALCLAASLGQYIQLNVLEDFAQKFFSLM